MARWKLKLDKCTRQNRHIWEEKVNSMFEWTQSERLTTAICKASAYHPGYEYLSCFLVPLYRGSLVGTRWKKSDHMHFLWHLKGEIPNWSGLCEWRLDTFWFMGKRKATTMDKTCPVKPMEEVMQVGTDVIRRKWMIWNSRGKGGRWWWWWWWWKVESNFWLWRDARMSDRVTSNGVETRLKER